MKKILTAVVLSAVMLAPTAVSAATDYNVSIVSPEDTKWVIEYQMYPKSIYPTCAHTPYSYYTNTWDGYSGWMYQDFCFDAGTYWDVRYSGWLNKY